MGSWIPGTHQGSWNRGVIRFQQQIIEILMDPGFQDPQQVGRIEDPRLVGGIEDPILVGGIEDPILVGGIEEPSKVAGIEEGFDSSNKLPSTALDPNFVFKCSKLALYLEKNHYLMEKTAIYV